MKIGALLMLDRHSATGWAVHHPLFRPGSGRAGRDSSVRAVSWRRACGEGRPGGLKGVCLVNTDGRSASSLSISQALSLTTAASAAAASAAVRGSSSGKASSSTSTTIGAGGSSCSSCSSSGGLRVVGVHFKAAPLGLKIISLQSRCQNSLPSTVSREKLQQQQQQ
jgi:hypothetical protein